jgi:hypothetical protein
VGVWYNTTMTKRLADLSRTETCTDLNGHSVVATYRYAVAKVGTSRLGTTGGKTHIVSVGRIVRDGKVDTDYRGNEQVYLGGLCRANGARGILMEKLDVADVTCEKCLAWLAKQ